MRKSGGRGGRAVLIHVGLLDLKKQHSLCTYLNQTHHLHAGDRAGTSRGELTCTTYDWPTWLVGPIPAPLKKSKSTDSFSS